jgi:hypothetical protein
MYVLNLEKIKNLVSVFFVNLLHLYNKIGCHYLGLRIDVVESSWFHIRLNLVQIESQ